MKLNWSSFITFFKSPWSFRKVLIAGSAIVLSIGVFFSLLILLIWTGALGRLPNQKALLEIQNPAASEVYSADSVIMGRYFIQERSNINAVDLPLHVVDALLATEDIRFYNHHGIDYRSFGRVLIKSLIFQKESAGGGSTITQQLAKNLYPRKDYRIFSLFINKIREMFIASRMEKAYDKQSILTLYFNTIPFGDNTYGLEAAAQRFYSIPAKNLTIDQAAVLIGMLKANHLYNPRIFPERALTRRNVVLHQMEKYQMIDEATLQQLQSQPLVLAYKKINHHSGLAPYFREHLRAELLAWCEKYNGTHTEQINLYTAGLKIYTTIDSRMQRYAEEAMNKQMAETQKKFLNHWGKQDPWFEHPETLKDAIRKSDHFQRLQDQGMSEDSIMLEMEKPVMMNIFTWDKEDEILMSPVDSIKHYLKFLNAGMLGMDPQHGAIRVWVGGINHHFFQYDHVRENTKRQVGSTFKPIVYAAALERGVRPCAFISAEKTVYNNMDDWTPENASQNYDLKYSMPGALAYSVNTVSIRLLEKAGIENTVRLARRMGIASPIEHVPSLALGTSDISMMEMVRAYACFANDGKNVTPYYISSITKHNGEVLESFVPEAETQALSSESAQLILHMLRRAVNEGTSAAIRSQFKLTNDLAGKTGTTQSNADGWFMGITPKLVIGTWVGSDNPAIRFRSTALGQGARTALPIAGEFLQRMNADRSLDSVSRVRFPALSPAMQKKLACDLSKSDKNIFRRISGRKERKKNFGEPEKKGFFKKLFSRED